MSDVAVLSGKNHVLFQFEAVVVSYPFDCVSLVYSHRIVFLFVGLPLTFTWYVRTIVRSQGPDSSRIYDADGYDYLQEEFPRLDYIDRCFIVNEEATALTEDEEL